MAVPILQIDAFTAAPFRGNPAAVCLLDAPADPSWMQQVAAEMNLAETAFVVPDGDRFGLRWFTPEVEVALCGHATLASAHALWETGRVPAGRDILFETLSGTLGAVRDGDRIAIELPSRPVAPADPPAALIVALGAAPRATFATVAGGTGAHPNYLLEYGSVDEVTALRPDFARLRGVPGGVIVTARGTGRYDFVSRFFAAPYGVDEDPVTGSAHCSLAPFWADRLGKTTLLAWQASKRGGELGVTLRGDRVRLAGHAVTVLRGELVA
ncbi:MAG TPA: PhzF family phenazine biosynthesis protein [Vicinamibacterales bacterium]